MKKIINYLNETIKKQKQILVFTIFIFLIGLIIGSLFINFVNEHDKLLLINQINTYFENIKSLSSEVIGINVFTNTLLNNYLQLLLIFALGISMIGVLVLIFILFFKGFTLGVTLSSIILKYQIKGVLASFLYIFPVVILNIFIYLFMSFFAVHVSIKFLSSLIKKDKLNFKSFLGKYLLSFILSLICMLLCSLFEAFLSPLLLKLFTFII